MSSQAEDSVGETGDSSKAGRSEELEAVNEKGIVRRHEKIEGRWPDLSTVSSVMNGKRQCL